MAQAIPTTCDHNAQGQVLLSTRPVACRKCGAQVQQATYANATDQRKPNAAYPADATSADTTWAFAQ